jgi:uncharacterized integral membrane protein
MKQKPFLTWEDAMVIAVAFLMVALVGGPLVVLVFENSAILMIEVPLTVFGWHAPQVPLALILLLSGLLGALLLYMIAVFSAWQDRRALAQLRRRVMELEQAQEARGHPASYPLPQV